MREPAAHEYAHRFGVAAGNAAYRTAQAKQRRATTVEFDEAY